MHIAGGMDQSFEDYYYALQSIVADLGIQEKVTFYGNVKETWDWYHKIDIFISNSYSEGLQVAPMEAMASGCYCLSHRWRGADELLPQEYLYFTDTELREKILQYCVTSEEKKLEQTRSVCVRSLKITLISIIRSDRWFKQLMRLLLLFENSTFVKIAGFA